MFNLLILLYFTIILIYGTGWVTVRSKATLLLIL